MCGIYKIENLKNGKVYVGQAVDIKRRWSRHRMELKKGIHSNKYLQRAYDKYGVDAFRYSVIEECPKEKLNEREIFYIQKFDSFSNGYNLQTGGEGSPGRKHTEAELDRLRHSRKPRVVYQIDSLLNVVNIWESAYHAAKGTGFNANKISTCASLYNSQKVYEGFFWLFEEDMLNGKVPKDYFQYDPTIVKRVSQYDLDMNLIKIWNSITEISENTPFDGTSIYNACNGFSEVSHGYVWRYTDYYSDEDYQKDILKEFSYSCNVARAVCQYDYEGKFIAEYDTLQKAADAVNGNSTNISQACRKKSSSYLGYIWKYKKDGAPTAEELKSVQHKLKTRHGEVEITQYTLNGEKIKTYSSAAQIEKELGFSRKKIIKTCNKKDPVAYGFLWEREKPPKRTHKGVPVLQFTQDNSFVQRYSSLKEANLKTGLPYSGLLDCLRGRRKEVGGYIWKYEEV